MIKVGKKYIDKNTNEAVTVLEVGFPFVVAEEEAGDEILVPVSYAKNNWKEVSVSE